MNGANLPRSNSPPPPVELPDLELLGRIDAGNYGEVWLARTVTGALRAVKIVRRDRFETAEPFDREYAGITAYEPLSRTHEGLMDILHVGRNDADGWFHCVMELADDGSESRLESFDEEPAVQRKANEELAAPDRLKAGLRTYTARTLESEVKSQGRLSVARCVEIGVALADALHYLHQHELVHRDVKPANVIFVGGIAKLADPGSIKSKHKPHTLIGTEGYIPPEGPGRPQGDVFSLGRLLYEASTGRPAHEYPNAPSDVATWPDHLAWLDLNEVICRACQMDPADRYASAGEMRDELALLRAGKSLLGLRKLERHLSRLRKLGVVAAVAMMIGAIAYQLETKRAAELQRLGDQARERVVRLHVAQGARALDEDDYLTALGWFIAALKAERGNQEREEIHRYRIELVFQGCPTLLAFGYHDGAIQYGAFSPDGSRLVTASMDGSAQVWSATSSQRIGKPMRHNDGLEMAIFSPDGARVATASRDGKARIWDAATGEPISPPLRHRSLLYYLAFDATRRRLATASKDGTARILDVFSGEPLTGELRHESAVKMAVFSPDGETLLTASDDQTARLWEASTGRQLIAPMRHEDHVRCAVFSPDGRAVVTASRDGIIRFWSANSGEQIAPEERIWESVREVRFSPDGEKVYAVGGDSGKRGELRGWNWRTGMELFKPVSFSQRVSHLAVSPDGRWLLSAGAEGKAYVYDASLGVLAVPVITQQQHISRSAFAPDGHRILTVSLDGTWRVWDLAAAARHPVVLEHKGHKTDVRFIDGGKRVLLGSIEGIVSECDVESGRVVRRVFDYGGKVRQLVLSYDARFVAVFDSSAVVRIFDLMTGKEISQREHLWPQVFARFDPTGTRVVDEDGALDGEDFLPRSSYAVRVWNVTTGRDVVPPMLHSNWILWTALSPDGRFIATACGNRRSKSSGYVQVWDLRCGRPAGQPITTPTAPRQVEFSSNGQLLLISTGDDVSSPGWVELRNARTGKLMARTASTLTGVSPATFSPDGSRFLAARGNGIAQVFNTFTGEATSQEMPHGRGLGSVGFSPDGRRVFTSSAAGFSRWWDAQTGEPITPRMPHRGPAVVSTLSPDGSTLISAGSDDSARVWRLRTNSLPVLELDRLARLLTGRKLDATTGPEAVPPSELLELWQSVVKP